MDREAGTGMAEPFVAIGLAFVLCLAGIWLRHICHAPPEYEKKTSGTVVSMTRPELHVMYYIKFEEDGVEYSGRTPYYDVLQKKYNVGDTVPIRYMIDDDGMVHVTIDDSRLKTRGSRSLNTAYGICFMCAVWLCAFGVIRLIINAVTKQ